MPQPAQDYVVLDADPARQARSPKILLLRGDLKALGIPFENQQLLRLEFIGRFPRRIRLSGSTVCWDRDEILAWIEARKTDRSGWHYEDPT